MGEDRCSCLQVLRSWVIPFWFWTSTFRRALSAFAVCRCSFTIRPVCFDISEDDRMASQTVGTLFWSQLRRLLCWLLKVFHNFLTFVFCNQEYTSAFNVFLSVSLDFCCGFWNIFLLQGFLLKILKTQEFNNVRALVLNPSNEFVTKVCLSYRACLQRPTYGISVIIGRSFQAPRAFLIRSIHGPRAILLSRISGRRVLLTRSCHRFDLWESWGVQGCTLVS